MLTLGTSTVWGSAGRFSRRLLDEAPCKPRAQAARSAYCDQGSNDTLARISPTVSKARLVVKRACSVLCRSSRRDSTCEGIRDRGRTTSVSSGFETTSSTRPQTNPRAFLRAIATKKITSAFPTIWIALASTPLRAETSGRTEPKSFPSLPHGPPDHHDLLNHRSAPSSSGLGRVPDHSQLLGMGIR